MSQLSRNEEFLMLCVWKLRGNAYTVTIKEHLEDVTGASWSIGAIYDVLDRLVHKGLVATTTGKPQPVRGGRARRYYHITEDGRQALKELQAVQAAMWSNLPKPITE